jgi:hypothetical protein
MYKEATVGKKEGFSASVGEVRNVSYCGYGDVQM